MIENHQKAMVADKRTVYTLPFQDDMKMAYSIRQTNLYSMSITPFKNKLYSLRNALICQCYEQHRTIFKIFICRISRAVVLQTNLNLIKTRATY